MDKNPNFFKIRVPVPTRVLILITALPREGKPSPRFAYSRWLPPHADLLSHSSIVLISNQKSYRRVSSYVIYVYLGWIIENSYSIWDRVVTIKASAPIRLTILIILITVAGKSSFTKSCNVLLNPRNLLFCWLKSIYLCYLDFWKKSLLFTFLYLLVAALLCKRISSRRKWCFFSRK